MGQNALQRIMGTHGSTDFICSSEPGDPTTFKAGLAVRRATTGSLVLASGSGSLIGLSLGRGLSNATSRTSVLRAGNLGLIRIAEYVTKAQLTFTSKVPGTALTIVFTSGATAGSEVVTVTGGNAIGVQISNATSTTTQIKTAIDGNTAAAALIEVAIASGQGSTAVSTFTISNISVVDQAVLGASVKVSNVTGAAVPTAATGTVTGAVYIASGLSGLDPHNSGAVECTVAEIDMNGGL